MINVEIEANLVSEKNRIIATYANVLDGFFIKNGFYPLPYSLKNNIVETVVLPNFDYSKMDSKTILKIKQNGLDFDFGFINNSVIFNTLFEEVDFKGISFNLSVDEGYKREIKKYLDEVILKYTNNFKYLKNKIFNVKVFVTEFGTLGSFNSVTKEEFNKDTINLYFYLRKDMPSFYICELFLSAVTYNLVHGFSNSWQNGEAVSDFLTMYFMDLPDFIPTLKATEEINKKLLHESISYLHSLGISANSVLEYDMTTDKIFIRNKEITNIFSSYERLVLTHFIKNKGTVVTFDDIAKVLYGESAETNFSLWGINKCIQRVRNKLVNEGIPKSIIKNVKGVGFVF